MEKLTAELIINGINAVGTLLLGITAVIGIPKIISNLAIRNETLYGEEAVERHNQIEKKLSKSSVRKLDTLEFGGGDGFIVPRLVVQRISYKPQTMGDDWKGRKAIVKFYKKEENGKTVIRRWLL